ncbi:MAG: rod shape-determining protein RodA [Candidatus Palauibacterales bacterium]|nr:rod shape-determining protein RodA [Candidatus Palauibacterales bacterium]
MRRGRATRLGSLGDPALLAAALLLAVLGIGMIWSAGQVDLPSAVMGAWRRQLAWLGVAILGFGLASRVPMRWLEWATPWIYAFSILLLLVVLAVGGGPNTRSWLRLAGFSFQPAELAKLATILLLARILGSRKEPQANLFELWKPVLIVAVPFLLVMAQPDLGSALIFVVILVSALYWAGTPLFTIFMLVSPGVSMILGFSSAIWGVWFVVVVLGLYLRRPFMAEAVAVALANLAAGALATPLWNRLAPYQQRRLVVFLDPDVDPRGAGWHLIQSKVAIGSGGMTGQGFGHGPQKRLAFLPEQHTDFIFSVVGEELGLIGVLAFLLLLAWFLRRVLRVAAEATQGFGSMVAFCFFAVWFAHLVINVGMTVGLMPVTGLPLPFISYGGSFLLTTFVGLGLVCRAALET